MKNLIDEVNLLRKNGDYEYVISKYIKKNYWINKVKNAIKERYSYDMTDFNYGTCFSVWINISNTNAEVGTDAFREFLNKNSELTVMNIQISAIASYYIIRYLRYCDKNLKSSFYSSEYIEKYIEKKVVTLIEMEYNKRLYEKELNIIISDVKLELKEENVTIFNCLFEDEY